MKSNDPFNVLPSKKALASQPPGTISYTGRFTKVNIIIEQISYNDSEAAVENVENISGPFDEDKIYWFNVVGLHDVSLIKKIGEDFGLHPIEIEDIVQVSQWSKIEDNEQNVFSIMKMIYLKASKIIHEHVAIVWKDNVIITFQETPGDVFDELRERINKGLGRIRSKGSDYLFYSLIDALVDRYFVIINKLSDDFRDIEMKILDNDKDGRNQVYQLRKEVTYLVNAVVPINDSVERFREKESNFMIGEMAPYFSDLLEHLNQITDALTAYKEMTNSLYEMHMSNVSSDMNKTMMTLTIFSAIFIPLSFLAGVFGMNFAYIPGVDIKLGFYMFISVCVIIAGAMMIFFKSKKWF